MKKKIWRKVIVLLLAIISLTIIVLNNTLQLQQTIMERGLNVNFILFVVLVLVGVIFYIVFDIKKWRLN